MKYIGNFKKIVNLCLKRGWLATDPFLKLAATFPERALMSASDFIYFI
jgi:hypothetical protein